VTDAETKDGYSLPFVTYLARLLLNFDPVCQEWWRQQAPRPEPERPTMLSADDIWDIRRNQFAKFSASVELSLARDYAGDGGTERLLQQLLQRYGSSSSDSDTAATAAATVDNKNNNEASMDDTNRGRLSAAKRLNRETKEARRQIALLFGLLPAETQPTQEITKLLAAIDNGSLGSVEVLQQQQQGEANLRGFRSEDQERLQVVVPPPPASRLKGLENDGAPNKPQYEQAQGTVVLEPTGQLLTLDVLEGGSGYYSRPPRIVISPPTSDKKGRAATATAQLTAEGTIKSIQLDDAGEGYRANDKITVSVVAEDEPVIVRGQSQAKNNNKRPTVVNPRRDAILSPVLDMKISKVQVTNPGSGYAVEKPLTVQVDISSSSKGNEIKKGDNALVTIGVAYPQAEKTSFAASRLSGDNQVRNYEKSLLQEASSNAESNNPGSMSADGNPSIQPLSNTPIVSGTTSGGSLPPSSFVVGKASSSEQLLSLLPEGFGLEYDSTEKRYFLSVDQDYIRNNPSIALQSSGKSRPLVPDFGPRGMSPIERDMLLDVDSFSRFLLAGAICTSSIYLLLTPLDVMKTKVQTNPARYPTIGGSFQTVWKDEGFTTFFTGWLPTGLGHFAGGAVLYAVSEALRRYLTDMAGVSNALSLEVAIILASAAVASAAAGIVFCPFEAIRIRTVAQPDYAPNSVKVLERVLKEEGIGSLVNAIPVFLAKNVPYAMAKFLIFDLSSEFLFRAYPVAQEDLRLSLLVSLLCGVLGGVSAAFVSNPADMLIAELKKAKSDQSPVEALRSLLDQGGYAALFKGLPLRMALYSLATALQFTVYDGVRFALGVGPDDLRLYYDVLGGALSTKGTIA